jgi:hypothetical protein
MSVISSVMGALGGLFGTPKKHEQEKDKLEVVQAPEFDITQYAKKLAVVVGVIGPAAVGTLKLFGNQKVTPGIVIGAFGLTAAALLGVSLVMAVDLASRSYLVGVGAQRKAREREEGKEKSDSGGAGHAPGAEVVSAPRDTLVWLKDDPDPHPVLAMAGDGAKASSYLVASGSTVERAAGAHSVEAIDGPPEWHPAEEVRAVKTANWP